MSFWRILSGFVFPIGFAAPGLDLTTFEKLSNLFYAFDL